MTVLLHWYQPFSPVTVSIHFCPVKKNVTPSLKFSLRWTSSIPFFNSPFSARIYKSHLGVDNRFKSEISQWAVAADIVFMLETGGSRVQSRTRERASLLPVDTQRTWLRSEWRRPPWRSFTGDSHLVPPDTADLFPSHLRQLSRRFQANPPRKR